MRILLVLDRVENPASANALMGFRLAEQLLRRNRSLKDYYKSSATIPYIF